MKKVNEFVNELSTTNNKKLLSACRSLLTDRLPPYALMYIAKYVTYQKDFEAFQVIAASIAKKVPNTNSYTSLGNAIAKLDYVTNKSNQESIRMDRLLRAETTEDIIEQYTKMIGILSSKHIEVNHTQLLKDFIFFNDEVKHRWAMDYFKVQEFNDEV